MNPASALAARNKDTSMRPAPLLRVVILLAIAAYLALSAGCASVGTTVSEVWRDDGRPDSPLGKTLVLALVPQAEVVTRLENEWVRELRDHGVDAQAASPLLPGEKMPEEQQVVELVRAGGFNTLLLCRLLDVKHVEREVSSYQVAVVETILYDAATEERFWSARADTFLVNPTGEKIVKQRDERVREFVETLIGEMAGSKVL